MPMEIFNNWRKLYWSQESHFMSTTLQMSHRENSLGFAENDETNSASTFSVDVNQKPFTNDSVIFFTSDNQKEQS